MLSLPMCCINNSDIDSSRSHPSHDWHQTKLNDLILLFSSNLFSLVAHVPGQFRVVRVCCKILQALFSLLQHQNCLATSDRVTLHFYFSLGVSGSIGDTFEFTNLRRYRSKSEFFDVFKQDKCPSLDLKEFSFEYV